MSLMLGVFLDSETNGLNPKIHKVIEIAFQVVDLLSGKVKLNYHTVLSLDARDWEQSDKDSLMINGITWSEVTSGKPIDVVSKEIIDHFTRLNIVRKQAVFICQNPSFDRVFFSQIIDPKTQDLLQWPYHWLDLASMHYALSMKQALISEGPYPWETGLSKDKIAEFYNIPPEDNPHRAMNGVTHLIKCYEAVIGFLQN